MIKGLGVGVCTALVLAIVPAAASAATVTTREGEPMSRIEFRAKQGEANDIAVGVRRHGRLVRIVDAGNKIKPGHGCHGGRQPGKAVRCTVPRPDSTGLPDELASRYVTLEVNLGDGDDRYDSTALPRALRFAPERRAAIYTNLDSGEGADIVETGASVDTITSGPGPDLVSSGRSYDLLEAGREADGADVLDGGRGGDAAYYAHRTAAVQLSLDDVANDGEAGEGDQILRVESLGGGAGDDVITGDGGRNVLFASGGADAVSGLGRDDAIYGDDLVPIRVDDSVEQARAAAGDDYLDGGRGDDDLTGAFGADHLVGDRGRDELDAGTGVLIPGDDGRLVLDRATDQADCGAGRDELSLEKRDRHSSCEDRDFVG